MVRWSDSIRVATETPTLGRVGGVSMRVDGTSQITVTWDSVANAQLYRIQWRSSAQSFVDGGSRDRTTSSTQYALTSLSANTTYYVQIRAEAVNYNDGDWSFEENQTTERQTLATPNAPSLSVLSSSSIRASWSSVPNATSYRVHWRASGGGTQTRDTSSLSYTLTGLQANTTHFVAVQALTTDPDFQNSDVSNENSAMTSQSALGQVPSFNLSSGQNSISASWGSVSNATAYDVEWRSSSQSYSSSRSITTSGTSRTISSLQVDTLYYVRVRATASGFLDGAWNERTIRTDQAPALGQVTGLGFDDITSTNVKLKLVGIVFPMLVVIQFNGVVLRSHLVYLGRVS